MAWEPLPDQHVAPRALATSLERLHRTMGLARPDTVRLLERHWPSLFGSELAGACRLEAVRDGELVVVVSDPAVAEHLRWSRRDVLAAANSVCGGEVVTSLRVKVARHTG